MAERRASDVSLSDLVRSAAGRPAGRPRVAPGLHPELGFGSESGSGAVSLSEAVKDAAARERRKPSTRAGRVGIIVYVDDAVSTTMGRLAAEVRTTKTALGEMAFRLLFEKFSEPWPQ